MKKINIIFLLTFLMIIFLGFIKPILFPNSVNEYENRESIRFSAPTFETILSGSFQKNIETAYADQIPLATIYKKEYNYITNSILLSLIKLSNNYNTDKYISFNNVSLFHESLVKKNHDLLDGSDEFYKRIESFNQYIKKYNNIDFYFYYIEGDSDINFETNKKNGAYEYFEKNLESSNISKFAIDNYSQYFEYYYKTDHHWNNKGAYKGYTEIMKLMNINDVLIPTEEVCLNSKYEGARTREAGANNILYEDFCVYKYDWKEHNTFVDNIEKEYGNEQLYFNGQMGNATYDSFYGENSDLIVFDYNDTSKENILVLSDSFDNAIIKIIANHFNKTYSVDLRGARKWFDFSEFVEKNKIDKVIFIGEFYYYNTETLSISD